jgi:hypothetical protein
MGLKGSFLVRRWNATSSGNRLQIARETRETAKSAIVVSFPTLVQALGAYG